jgi:hypothetical protein
MHDCRVCGKPLTYTGAFGVNVTPVVHDHSDEYRRWFDLAAQLRDGSATSEAAEKLKAAQLAVAAAEEERDRLFLEAMIGAGIPDWFAKSRVEDLYDY